MAVKLARHRLAIDELSIVASCLTYIALFIGQRLAIMESVDQFLRQMTPETLREFCLLKGWEVHPATGHGGTIGTAASPVLSNVNVLQQPPLPLQVKAADQKNTLLQRLRQIENKEADYLMLTVRFLLCC